MITLHLSWTYFSLLTRLFVKHHRLLLLANQTTLLLTFWSISTQKLPRNLLFIVLCTVMIGVIGIASVTFFVMPPGLTSLSWMARSVQRRLLLGSKQVLMVSFHTASSNRNPTLHLGFHRLVLQLLLIVTTFTKCFNESNLLPVNVGLDKLPTNASVSLSLLSRIMCRELKNVLLPRRLALATSGESTTALATRVNLLYPSYQWPRSTDYLQRQGRTFCPKVF